MVATVLTLLRLRFRVLGNSLARSPMQRVAVGLGALQALVLVLVAVAIAWWLLQQPTPMQRQAPWVAVGSLVTIGWVLAPLVIGGAESTLEPRRLARYPVPAGRKVLAELLVGLTWVPAGATLLAALAGALVWTDRPAAAAVAVPAAALAVLVCVVAGRTAVSLAALLVAALGPIGRLLATLVAAVVLLVPPAVAVASNWPPWERFDGLVAGLAFDPLGAAWAIPGFVAEGRTGEALAALGVVIAALALLGLCWRLAIGRGLRGTGSGGRRRRARGLGPFASAPSGATGAIAARGLVLWFRDSRLTIQLAVLPIVPVLLVVLARLEGIDWLAYIAAPLAAALLPLSQFAAISYDGTAFASEVAAGVRGRADRLGRAAAMLSIAVPVVVAIAVLAPIAVGTPDRIPAVLGLALAALLTASAVTAVSSALVVVPVPAAGRNPFATPSGSATAQILGSYAVTGVAAALMVPVAVLGAFALVTADPWLGVATLAGGLAWGLAAFLGGVAAGGRILDRSAPELLEQLQRIRMR